MIYNRAAHRYAKATLESCLKDKKELDLVFQDMKNISVSFENSKELKLFVDSKVVKDLIKLNALKAVFKNSSNKTKDLMELLMNNKRIDLFDDVANSFIMLYNKYAQNQEVVLTSSSHLRPSTIKEIEKASNQKVAVLETTYDSFYGFPAKLYIDRDERIADEEIGYSISNFKPL